MQRDIEHNIEHNNEDPVGNAIVQYMQQEAQSGHTEHSLNEIKDGLKNNSNGSAPSQAEILEALGKLQALQIIGTRKKGKGKKKKHKSYFLLPSQPSAQPNQ
jgi:hypothetical protein